jgi:hypothetical protein
MGSWPFGKEWPRFHLHNITRHADSRQPDVRVYGLQSLGGPCRQIQWCCYGCPKTLIDVLSPAALGDACDIKRRLRRDHPNLAPSRRSEPRFHRCGHDWHRLAVVDTCFSCNGDGNLIVAPLRRHYPLRQQTRPVLLRPRDRPRRWSPSQSKTATKEPAPASLWRRGDRQETTDPR